jgi:hypothetical protein
LNLKKEILKLKTLILKSIDPELDSGQGSG